MKFLVGLVLAIAGTWLMVTESAEIVEVVRDTSRIQAPVGGPAIADAATPNLHMKGFILRLLAAAGDRGLWDHEIMQAVAREYHRHSAYWQGELRVTLTDLHSGALIDEIADALDDGRHFGAGRILMKFRLSPFGRERMQETGLL